MSIHICRVIPNALGQGLKVDLQLNRATRSQQVLFIKKMVKIIQKQQQIQFALSSQIWTLLRGSNRLVKHCKTTLFQVPHSFFVNNVCHVSIWTSHLNEECYYYLGVILYCFQCFTVLYRKF